MFSTTADAVFSQLSPRRMIRSRRMHDAVAPWSPTTQWLHSTYLSGLETSANRAADTYMHGKKKCRVSSEARKTQTEVVKTRSKLGARPNLHTVLVTNEQMS